MKLASWMSPIMDGLCRNCDMHLQKDQKCVECFIANRRREKVCRRRCRACASEAMQIEHSEDLVVDRSRTTTLMTSSALSFYSSAPELADLERCRLCSDTALRCSCPTSIDTSPSIFLERAPGIDMRRIVRGIFTPAGRIRRMQCVEQRPGDVRRLRCSTCNYEVTSSWYFISSQGTRSVLRPVVGHMPCRVGTKVSHFATVDGSASIPVSGYCRDTLLAAHRSIADGKYIPNEKIRRLVCVEERPEAVKRLRCVTCNYEITSSWFFVAQQGNSSVLKPGNGHTRCRMGTKRSPFTTVDGSSSSVDSAVLHRCERSTCKRGGD